jgi:glycosyltransferase involved in cell wall biosynthesis
MTPLSSPTPPTQLLDGRTVVTFANDWNADPTSKHHVMRRVARTNPVLWVEAAGMRAPQLSSGYDRRRILNKAKAMLRKARHEAEGVWSYSPPALPYPHSRVAQIANNALYRVSIRRQLNRLDLADPDPIICTFVPQCAPYIRGMPRSFLIYYCVDKWTEFKGYHREAMERGEEELCREADLVVASARDLAERCARYSDNVHYLPHGVDFDHFAGALDPGPLPDDLAFIPEPRVGFFGLLHEWVDLALIGRLADALPYSFVLIGSSSEDLSDLLRRKNVFHLGRRPYATLPSYSRGFAAALVPFQLTTLTASVNPIKLREYAAAGLPIVSSALPEVAAHRDIATCVTGDEAWIDAVREAVRTGQDPERRREQSHRVRASDWGGVSARLAALVNAVGAPTEEGRRSA